ncbi:MAG: 50S ribosomal protein L10 [Phycisphaerales bacterium]|nr:50S ribosomal protein L10 [Phycisphaerales bacterium]MCB9835335.1 50S ribosomal protein L10 [Phycisphaera sp.]
MSKPMKEMIVSAYQSRLGETEEALIVSLRGVKAEGTEAIRNKMREGSVEVTVVKNSLARKAFEGTALSALSPVLKGQNAVVFGDKSIIEIARDIIELIKTNPEIELKGALLEGELFEGEEGVTRLSKMPTLKEAQGNTVSLVLGPGRKLAGIIKAIEEKLEKGEEIAKVG